MGECLNFGRNLLPHADAGRVTGQDERADPLSNEHRRPVAMLALHFESAGPEFEVGYRL